jgi:hypothetical protein
VRANRVLVAASGNPSRLFHHLDLQPLNSS